MQESIPRFENARVLVTGDVMLDRYWHGSASRISPEAPVPVVLVEKVEARPGGAGNVALNIAALGGKATLLGLTGDDEAADLLEDRLVAAEVRSRMYRMVGYKTVTKLRVLSRHQQLIRLDMEDGFPGERESVLCERFEEELPRCDVVVLSDYGKGTLRAIRKMIEAARAANKPILVDPKSQDFECYRGVSLITPNRREFEVVVGLCRNQEELVDKAFKLIQQRDLGGLLITRGEEGMSLVLRDKDPLHLPTQAREVFDVTGAGDTVIAMLATSLAAGVAMPKAMALANFAAAIVVGKLGTATVSGAELRHECRIRQMSLGRGVYSEQQLLDMVRDAREHSETIVMTNGCFDLLHAGHVEYLAEAKALGDRLIVALNDDDSVRGLKGPGRPINTWEQRATVLSALESVDWVVAFSEETPERLICQVKPDYLVKGGDYRAEDIAGYDCVQKEGGKVVVLGFQKGCSSSTLIDKIRQR